MGVVFCVFFYLAWKIDSVQVALVRWTHHVTKNSKNDPHTAMLLSTRHNNTHLAVFALNSVSATLASLSALSIRASLSVLTMLALVSCPSRLFHCVDTPLGYKKRDC